MFDHRLITAFLNQPETVILPLVTIGWFMSAWGIYRVNESLKCYLEGMASTSTSCLGDLKISVLFAWPVYWLILFFALVNRDFAWSACLAMLPTLLVLPAALAPLRSGKIHYFLNAVSAAFLALALLVLCGSGIGLDRVFTRLGGHFILTVFLLFLWWEWPVRKTQTELPFRPRPKDRRGPVVFPIILYHLGAGVLLLSTLMLKTRFQVHPGLTFGLLVALAWTPSLTKILTSAQTGSGTLITFLPLAILFLIGPLTLVFGPVDFPITLWQMEICTSLLLALLWLGLAFINQPLNKIENSLLLTLYIVYLGLRIFRLL